MAIESFPVLSALWQWSPALVAGFGQNILISLLAIAIGSALGLLIGALALSPLGFVARLWVQVFRNAPWLVLIYFTTYVFPFEIHIGSSYVSFPDWVKVTIGLALPASANVAEIFRGPSVRSPARNGKRRGRWRLPVASCFARSSCRSVSSACCRPG